MSHKVKNAVGYDEMIVIFIDVLGTKNCNDFIKNKEIHDIFHGSVKYQEVLDKADYNKDSEYNRRVYSFSDCAYIVYSFKESIVTKDRDKAKLAHAALINTSFILTRILSIGRLIRGSVCFGECYCDNNGCFGPSVNRAYEIESKNTIYPVVKIEDGLGEEIYKFQQELNNNDIKTVVEKEEFGYILKPFMLFDYFVTFYYQGFTIVYPELKKILLDYLVKSKNIEDDPSIHEKIEYFRNKLIAYTPR